MELQVLEIKKKLFGEDNLETLKSLENLSKIVSFIQFKNVSIVKLEIM